jgi:hypothetical protein
MSAWRSVLLVRLPLAFLACASAAEAGAWLLRDVPPRRHDLDRLVLAIDAVPMSAEIVLLGDSVTQDVARSYRLAPPGRLANLTTNQASGVAGSYLLLSRYLDRNPPPRFLVVAATPEFLAYDPEGRAAGTYLTSVFRRPAERAALGAAPAIPGTGRWRPAAFDLEARLVEPLIAAAMPRPTAYLSGDLRAEEMLEPEPPPVPEAAEAGIRARRDKAPALAPSARWALGRLCERASALGIRVRLLRAPVPESVLAARRADGGYAALDRAVMDAASACPDIHLSDANDLAAFPDHAMRDGDHLRRPGWTSRYATLLAGYLAALE